MVASPLAFAGFKRPPLIRFEYEQILDERRFARPANDALLPITGHGEASVLHVDASFHVEGMVFH